MASAMLETSRPQSIPLPEDAVDDFPSQHNPHPSVASMVTVRLSDSSMKVDTSGSRDSLATISLETPVEDRSEIEEEEEPSTPVMAHAPESNNETPRPRPLTIYTMPSTLQLRIDDGDNDESAIVDSREGSDTASNHNSQRSSASISKVTESTDATDRRRSDSTSSEEEAVDWQKLDKVEESESHEASEESVALLLARLEQENNMLAHDPKSGIKAETRAQRLRKGSRPPSMMQLRKMVEDPKQARFSTLPSPPPMTELEFWTALVQDYTATVLRLPTLTSNKVRAGVPPPLRGVVWVSMAGAREPAIEAAFDRLCNEPSPYEGIINKDIGRSFPGVEMFRDADGEGQRMLKTVLKTFSLYDDKIGYCQGLGFLVGPLLMQAGEKEAFCLLVRLMEQYDLRSCFLPDLSGLHLRIYQFQQLLSQSMPELTAHLESMQIEAAYLSQWFLSFFAVTCPLPLLFRIYDVIFAEGASETLMRVALAIMKRNEQKILGSIEFEEIMHLLLSRSVWDPYGQNGDDIVRDLCDFTNIVTRERLVELETAFREEKHDSNSKNSSPGGVQAAAANFLNRIWWSGLNPPRSATLSPDAGQTKHRGSFLRRTPSKQSISSDLGSAGLASSITTSSTVSTVITEPDSNPETMSIKSAADSLTQSSRATMGSADRDLHGQIEDLLTAMSEMQREQALLAASLQKEREERSEDGKLVASLIQSVRAQGTNPTQTSAENAKRMSMPLEALMSPTSASLPPDVRRLAQELESRFQRSTKRRSRSSAIFETKASLRDSLTRKEDELRLSVSRAADLNRELEEKTRLTGNLQDELREARQRLRDGYEAQQKLERQITELRQEVRNARRPSLPKTASAPRSTGPSHSPARERSDSAGSSHSGRGLRELKLGRVDTLKIEELDTYTPVSERGTPILETPPPVSMPTAAPHATSHGPTPSLSAADGFPTRRTSSLAARDVLTTEPVRDEALLLELVNAKTAEAVARQELEEVRGKLDALRKILGGAATSPPTPGGGGHRAGLSISTTGTTNAGMPSAALSTGGIGGVFKGFASPGHKPTKSQTLENVQSREEGERREEVRSGSPASAASTPGAPGAAAGGWFGWGKRSASRGVEAGA